MKSHNRIIRVILIALAVAFVLVPIAIVGITGDGFGTLAADILVSLSILSAMAATLVGIKRNGKSRIAAKIGISVGLLIVLLSLWL